jgi:hypothetical protein
MITFEVQGCLVACSGISLTIDTSGIQGSISLGFGVVGAQTPIGGVRLGWSGSTGLDSGGPVAPSGGLNLASLAQEQRACS